VFVLVKPYQLSLMFVVKTVAFPNGAPHMDHQVRALGLVKNIKLRWKSLPETDTLAYHKNMYITDENVSQH
jgi:hypothetical protein